MIKFIKDNGFDVVIISSVLIAFIIGNLIGYNIIKDFDIQLMLKLIVSFLSGVSSSLIVNLMFALYVVIKGA